MLSNRGAAEPKVNPAPGGTVNLQWCFWADVSSSLGKAVENKAKGEKEIPHRGHSNLGFTTEFGAQQLHWLKLISTRITENWQPRFQNGFIHSIQLIHFPGFILCH